MDEGLAQYFAYNTVLQTRYKQNEQELEKSRLMLAKKALDSGTLLSLSSISTQQQWEASHGKPEFLLQYAEAFYVASYLVQKHGMDKCLNVLRLIQDGDTQETALQKSLGISVLQLETDFKSYLKQLLTQQ